MKKITLLMIIGGAFIFASSCKKDRVCECTSTSGGNSTTSSGTLVNVTKKQAKDICVSKVHYDSNGNVSYTEDCKLK